MFINELHQGGIRAIIDYDNTVFDNMTLPEDIGGNEVIEQIVDRILYKYGDAPLFSPDPSVIKFYIGRWSTRHAPLWLRYYNAVTAEYDPLYNYDRTEKREFTHGKKVTYGGTVTDATSGSITDGTSGTVTNTPSGTITDSADYSVTNTIAADNSSTFENDTKASTNGKTNERTYTNYKEEQTYNQYQEQRTYNQYQEQRTYNNSDTNSGKDNEEVHIYGNIGVVSSVDLVKQELSLVPMLDFIDYVADDWHNEFCLMMYY